MYREEAVSSALHAFGPTVRELRLERQLSQEQLAHPCHLHRTYISGVERGERNVSPQNRVRIAHALSVPPSILPRMVDEEAASRHNP